MDIMIRVSEARQVAYHEEQLQQRTLEEAVIAGTVGNVDMIAYWSAVRHHTLLCELYNRLESSTLCSDLEKWLDAFRQMRVSVLNNMAAANNEMSDAARGKQQARIKFLQFVHFILEVLCDEELGTS